MFDISEKTANFAPESKYVNIANCRARKPLLRKSLCDKGLTQFC